MAKKAKEIKKVEYGFYSGFLKRVVYSDGTEEVTKIRNPARDIKEVLKKHKVIIRL
jgi:hypothetical protein